MTDLITIDDAKANLQWTSDDSRDEDLALYVTAASTIVEDIVGPVIGTSVVEHLDGGRENVILSDSATAVTSVVENGRTLPSTDYTVNLSAGIVWAGPSLFRRDFLPCKQGIVVTYTNGGLATSTDTVPAHLNLAVRELVRIWWQGGQQANWPNLANANYDATEYSPSGFAVPREIYALCKPSLRGPSV